MVTGPIEIPMPSNMRRNQARAAIYEYYKTHDGHRVLGAPVPVRDGTDDLIKLPENKGWQSTYRRGCICFLNSAPHAVVAVTGAIYTSWDAARHGLPKADRVAVAGGASQEFQGSPAGRVIAFERSGETDAYFVQGEILRRYLELGGSSGVLGLPGSNEEHAPGTADARISKFWNGAIYYRSDLGPFELTDVIWRGYHGVGASAGFLGFSMGGQLRTSGRAVIATFEGGVLYALEDRTFALRQEVEDFFVDKMGGPTSALGYPIDDGMGSSGPTGVVTFENGRIVSRDRPANTVYMIGAVYQRQSKNLLVKWLASPGEYHEYIVLYIDNQQIEDQRSDHGWASFTMPRQGLVTVSVDSYHIEGGIFGHAEHRAGSPISLSFNVQDSQLPETPIPTVVQTIVDITVSKDSPMPPTHDVDSYPATGHWLKMTDASNQESWARIEVPTGQAVVKASFDLSSRMTGSPSKTFELSGLVAVTTKDPDANGAAMKTTRLLELPAPQPVQVIKDGHTTIRFLVRCNRTQDSVTWDIHR